MITTIAGKNDFMIKRRVDELTAKFLAEHSALAMEKIDASDAELGVILDAVASVPFLDSRKMVVVRDLSANKQINDSIEQIISSTSPTTDLVIVEPQPDKRTVFYKFLKSHTTLEEYDEIDANSLSKWLVLEAQEMSAKLSSSDAAYLVDRVGLNQMQLFNELGKLTTFSSEINRESIDLLTEKAPQSKIFDLLDATFAGNKSKALELYDEQRAQKVEPQAIMALLSWQLNLISLAKYGAGMSASQIASDAKLNPYPVQKAQSLAAKITPEKLKSMVSDALDIDYRSKTTAIDLDEALKSYIVSL